MLTLFQWNCLPLSTRSDLIGNPEKESMFGFHWFPFFVLICFTHVLVQQPSS